MSNISSVFSLKGFWSRKVHEDDFWRLRLNAPPSGTSLGFVREIADGNAKELTFGRGRSAFSMFVVRVDDGGVRGYLNICPHFSLPLNHEPNAFVANGFIRCVQHFALFQRDDGACVAGACEGARLVSIPVLMDGDGHMTVG